MFLVNGTMPTCKASNRWNNRIKIAETLRNRNPPVLQNPFVGMIRLRRLLEMILQIQVVFVPILHMQLTCDPTISVRRCLADLQSDSMLGRDCRRRLTLTCQNNRVISITQKVYFRQFGHQAIPQFSHFQSRDAASHPTNQSQGHQLSISISA